MIKPDPRIFEDLSRVAGGAATLLTGLREQLMNDLRTRMDELAARMDLVPREDFERLELQVAALREEIALLKGKVKPARGATESRKTATSKASTKKQPRKTKG